MLLTIICIVLILISSIWLRESVKHNGDSEIGPIFCTVLFGMLFVINIIWLSIYPNIIRSEIIRFEAARTTIVDQRGNASEYERATITKEIVGKNQWLAENQFWAKNAWVNWFYPKEILEIKPIK